MLPSAPRGRTAIAPAIAALRPHQWIKNLLVLVPLILSHQIIIAGTFTAGLLACAAFCLCASAGYVLNDILDVAADRLHPRKASRPFASGALATAVAPYYALTLALGGFAIGLASLPLRFSAVLAGYCVGSAAYSFWLKRRPLVDVFALAGLYTIRIFGGGAATGIAISQWLAALSLFLFTSLAFAKRYTELSREGFSSATSGRGYQLEDRAIVPILGVAGGYASVLVLALYIHSPEMAKLYHRPIFLWMICPIALYWISRVWLLAVRGKLDDDPVIFAVKDKLSLALAVAAIALVVASSVR